TSLVTCCHVARCRHTGVLQQAEPAPPLVGQSANRGATHGRGCPGRAGHDPPVATLPAQRGGEVRTRPKRHRHTATTYAGSTFLENGTALYQERLAMVPDGAHLPFLPHIEILDTPPGLNDAWPAIQRADGLIIPVKPALQDILAVQEMLRLLADTRDQRPS